MALPQVDPSPLRNHQSHSNHPRTKQFLIHFPPALLGTTLGGCRHLRLLDSSDHQQQRQLLLRAALCLGLPNAGDFSVPVFRLVHRAGDLPGQFQSRDAAGHPLEPYSSLDLELYATGSNQQTVTFKLNSKNSIVLSKEVIVRTFLSGISSVGPVLLVELQTVFLTGLLLTMGLRIQLSATAQVWVGMVAFSSQTTSFSSYGGTALVGLRGDSSVDLLQTFNAVQVAFYGVSMMQISTVQSTLLDADIGSDFMLRMKLEGESAFKVNYIFLGQLPQGMCSNCRGNIYYEGQCLEACPSNTTRVKLINQAELCRKGQQPNISQSTQQTSTQQASTQQTSTQQTSTESSVQSSTRVSSSAGAGILGVSSMSSSTICSLPNMYWNGFECLCKVGFSLISNLCIQTILPPTTPTTTICQGSHQYSNGTACLCYTPYVMVSSSCVSQCK